MYRMTASLAPYATHPDLPQFHDQLGECEAELAATGELARALDIRLSSHPGQYVVLNSEDAARPGRRGPRPRVPSGADGCDGPGARGRRRPARRRRPGRRARALRGRLRAALGGGATPARDRERRPHVRPRRRARAAPAHRGARGLGHPAPPLPRSGRDPGPRGARGRARDLARRRHAEDPLLDPQDRARGTPAQGRPPRRARVGAAPAARPRRPDRPDRVPPVPGLDGCGPRLRHHARGQGQGPRAAAPEAGAAAPIAELNSEPMLGSATIRSST